MRVDKELVKKSFKKSISSYNENALIQRQICCKLSEYIDAYAKCTYKSVFEIGCGTGMLSDILIKDFGIEKYILNDIVPEMEDKIKEIMLNNKYSNYNFIKGDAEIIDFPKDVELIVSASVFQWFDDLNIVFKKIQDSLSSKGFFVYNSYGATNFKEIREITGNGLEYRSFEIMEELLKKYFTIKHSENTEKQLYFDTPNDVLKHLRYTGVNGTRVQKNWTKSTLLEFENKYKEKFSCKEGVYLTYNPVYFVCHK